MGGGSVGFEPPVATVFTGGPLLFFGGVVCADLTVQLPEPAVIAQPFKRSVAKPYFVTSGAAGRSITSFLD